IPSLACLHPRGDFADPMSCRSLRTRAEISGAGTAEGINRAFGSRIPPHDYYSVAAHRPLVEASALAVDQQPRTPRSLPLMEQLAGRRGQGHARWTEAARQILLDHGGAAGERPRPQPGSTVGIVVAV